MLYLCMGFGLRVASHVSHVVRLWSFGFGPLLLCRPAGLPGLPLVSVCGLPGLLSGVAVGRCSIVYELPRAGP